VGVEDPDQSEPLLAMVEVQRDLITHASRIKLALARLSSSGYDSISSMRRRFPLRSLAVPLILAIFILGVQVVAHFDGNSHDEDHCTCQVCHIAHAAIPQPAAQTEIQAPLWISRFASSEQASVTAEPANILSIPRAPPA
jgi:hypothetical protein